MVARIGWAAVSLQAEHQLHDSAGRLDSVTTTTRTERRRSEEELDDAVPRHYLKHAETSMDHPRAGHAVVALGPAVHTAVVALQVRTTIVTHTSVQHHEVGPHRVPEAEIEADRVASA